MSRIGKLDEGKRNCAKAGLALLKKEVDASQKKFQEGDGSDWLQTGYQPSVDSIQAVPGSRYYENYFMEITKVQLTVATRKFNLPLYLFLQMTTS